MPDLLFEIGTEEIPAGYILPALDALKKEFSDALKDHRLTAERVHVMGTPRRLALHAAGLPAQQESMDVDVAGPPKRIAFDAEGKPTKAAEGFARKQGIPLSGIRIRQSPKGEVCYAVTRVEGKKTLELLEEVLPAILRRLPFPKSMYWREPAEKFARPVRSLLALLGTEVVPFSFNGVPSGRETSGHPFLSPGRISLPVADGGAYVEQLRQKKVIVEVEERRASIERQLARIFEPYGSKHGMPELLEEVTNLVEWPHALEGRFSEEFLDVPAEVIVTAMTEHQRYFPIRDASGKLLNRFAVVSNREAEHENLIREGNERVLRARLADARFFWDEDRQVKLADRVNDLKSVLYQEKLGTYHDRTQRLCAMARFIGTQAGMGADEQAKLERAALLCKADLLTQMVYEFPALQGVMGREYARCDGEALEVAVAIEEHYRPRQAAGDLPTGRIGTFLALAEKADTVSACFAAGLAPTATQDPYGLRRQTLGIIRLITEKEISISLSSIFRHGLSLLPETLRSNTKVIDEIVEFFRDRLYHFCIERGSRYDLVNAVLASGFEDLLDFQARLQAIHRLVETPQWPSLVEIVERTFNITKGIDPKGEIKEGLLVEAPEKRLFAAFRADCAGIEELFASGLYLEGAARYHETFGEVVHDFFDKVYVNVDDPALKNNRLILVHAVHRLFVSRFANLVHVVMGGREKA